MLEKNDCAVYVTLLASMGDMTGTYIHLAVCVAACVAVCVAVCVALCVAVCVAVCWQFVYG